MTMLIGDVIIVGRSKSTSGAQSTDIESVPKCHLKGLILYPGKWVDRLLYYNLRYRFRSSKAVSVLEQVVLSVGSWMVWKQTHH